MSYIETSSPNLSSTLAELTLAVRDTQSAIEKLTTILESDRRLQDSSAPQDSQPDVSNHIVPVPLAGAMPSIDDSEPHRWYAVIVGRQPGVFCGSERIMANTLRIPGAYTLKFDSEAKARERFLEELLAGRVERVNVVVTRDMLDLSDFPSLA